jgi:hypothetical protein
MRGFLAVIVTALLEPPPKTHPSWVSTIHPHPGGISTVKEALTTLINPYEKQSSFTTALYLQLSTYLKS